MGNFEDSSDEERQNILEERLDLPSLLEKIDFMHEKIINASVEVAEAPTERNEPVPIKEEPEIVKRLSLRKVVE